MRLVSELRRRNVFRMAVLYVVAAWLIMQVAEVLSTLLPGFLPDWFGQVTLSVLAVGFPIALTLSWFYEITPEGVSLEKDVDPGESVTHLTGRRLDFIIISLLSAAVIMLAVHTWWIPEPPERSVAVLPFADLSQNQDQEWFADGLAEEILNALVRTPDLLISARTSTFAYKGTDKAIPTIAEELGVAHVVEGSVRRAGDRIRVTAQLIRAADGFHLWAQNYDRDSKDVIEIQEDIAVQIANALETTMDPESLKDMVRVGTSSVEAYQAYIHGMALQAESLLESDATTMTRAYQFFEQARAADPGFSYAHGAAAQYWIAQMSLMDFFCVGCRSALFQIESNELDSPVNMLQKFYERNDRAIATARNKIDVLYLRAKRAAVDLRFREALRLYRSYLSERPNDLIAWQAYLDTASSASDYDAIHDAMDMLREAGLTRPEAANYFMASARVHLEPDDGADYGLAAVERWPHRNIMYQTHRNLLYAQRLEEARQVMEMFAQRYPLPLLMHARQACAENRIDNVREIYEEGHSGAASINPYAFAWLMLNMLGEQEQAVAMLRKFEHAQVPFLLADWLTYEHFDPTPFPALMGVLKRENVDRPPPRPLPYACTPKSETL